ncbi:hypothetical protein SDC9_156452 [bioreactor metagenome]|uniref:Uncharacterized protein n=1 Tax=bioreactor metagenome TaxID=1076179 RepID=A0A645F9B3_9ZZZZ
MRAHHRRNRHRQGTGGPGRACAVGTCRQAHDQHQLRGPARQPGRERAVRSCARSLHRSAERAQRQVRAGASGNAVPGRGRRTLAARAGQAAARASKRPAATPRLRPGASCGCACDRCHQPRPGCRSRRRAHARGLLSPPQCLSAQCAAAARARQRRAAAGGLFPRGEPLQAQARWPAPGCGRTGGLAQSQLERQCARARALHQPRRAQGPEPQ